MAEQRMNTAVTAAGAPGGHDLTAGSATALARAIRARQVSAQEVVEAHLARSQAVNPQINAFVRVLADEAREQARQADAALARGEVWGPLHGVPVSVKDSFDTAGVVTTAGTAGRATYVPPEDATVVARLRAAGAILLGKTNLPELSLAFESDNDIVGRTSNPYDPGRTAGGSSGGEAALIAAGGSPLGVGTDAAGSLRVPAHFCGIATIKPTRGRVPLTGAFPPAIGAAARLWHAGPLARHVEDLITALPLLAGPDGRDPSAVPAPLGEPAAVAVDRLRAAFYVDNGIVPPTPETAEVVRRAAGLLAHVGAEVEEARPLGIEQSFELLRDLLSADGGATVSALLHMVGTATPSRLLQQLAAITAPYALPTADFADLLVRWDLFQAAMLAFMDRHDVLISPVCARPAVPHGTSFDPATLPAFSYTMTYSLTGWPSVVVRGGTSPEGLPIGVQVVARPWREDIALAVAHRLEQELGGWQHPLLAG